MRVKLRRHIRSGPLKLAPATRFITVSEFCDGEIGLNKNEYVMAIRGTLRVSFQFVPKTECNDVFINSYYPKQVAGARFRGPLLNF